MKNKYSLSVIVYIKKKYAYSERVEQMIMLAVNLGSVNIGGGADLSSGKRYQHFIFKTINDVQTFLDYPTVREAILSEVNVVPAGEYYDICKT